MGTITGTSVLSFNDLYTSETIVPGGLYVGAKAYGPQGQTYRYALVDSTGAALVVGNALQGSAYDSQFTNMAVPANLKGANPITVTNGTTTVVANQFDGGSLSTYTAGTDVIGDEYTITGHTTGTSGAALTVNLDRPLRAAFSTAAKVNMRRNPWSGVLQAIASTLTASPAGVAIYAIPVGTYGWVQTHGVGAALSDGSAILTGSAIAIPSATAGAVILSAAGLADMGYALQPAAATHAISVFLQID